MELNDYKSVTPLKKKRKKITASAALVLCLLCLLIGVLCGRAVSSNKQAQEAQKQVELMQHDMEMESSRYAAEISTYKDEINRLKAELAQTKKTLKEVQEAPHEIAPTEDDAQLDKDTEGENAAVADDEPEDTPKTSGGFLRKGCTAEFHFFCGVKPYKS